MNADNVVSSWLSGAEQAEGNANPAGPLYFDGAAAMEAAVEDIRENKISSARLCPSMFINCCP